MKPIAEESKAKVIAVYDAAAATYNRVGPSFFSHFGRRLASGTEIAPGSKVLDVATGTGAVLVPAAELVGDEGRVVGIDISPLMINRARTEIQKFGFCNTDVLVADAESLPFPQKSFDRVLCSFAIFLFSDLHSLISEWGRVLSSPGKIGLSESPIVFAIKIHEMPIVIGFAESFLKKLLATHLVYSAGEDQEWKWYEQLISRYEPTSSLGTERYSPKQVEATLEHFGFMNVATSVETHRLVFSNASEFWGWAWSHGDRGVLESLTGNRAEFKRELFEEFGKRASANGLPYQVSAAVTVGTKQ
jgi:ubiquinone/menaquinone biosynthesis C-methylase UbiE